jgi:hypothetical protein
LYLRANWECLCKQHKAEILSGATHKLEVYNELAIEVEEEGNGYPDEDFHAQKNCSRDGSVTDVTR